LKSKPSPPVDLGSQDQNRGLVRVFRILSRFERFGWDILGIVFLTLAAMTLVALIWPGLTSGFLKIWIRLWMGWFGWGIIWVIFFMGFLGVWFIKRKTKDRTGMRFWRLVFSIEGTAFASLALLSLIGGNSVERAQAGLDGGRIGWGLAKLMTILLGSVGFSGKLWQGIILGLILLISIGSGFGVFKSLMVWIRRSNFDETEGESRLTGMSPIVSEAPIDGEYQSRIRESKPQKRRTILPPQFRKNLVSPEEIEDSFSPPQRDERLPQLEMLVNEQANRPDERNINTTAGLIEKTLAEFGIPAKVVGYRIGPTVTQFAVEPGYLEKEKINGENDPNRQKVRVAQISSLGRDLALALAAERLRIEAPVPGRPYVGIEVPNTRSIIVRLRPILEQENFYRTNSPLAIALGRDVSGQPVVADLARMPHLLIAGTTGSGKSVCIAALTTCLVMNNTPRDLRLVMIDPKMVELVRFNGLPHLYGKVETEIERILAVLRWTMVEMDRRYKVLETSHSRNIESYNRKARRRKGEEPLPHIVVMIDELADLMMSAPDQTEHTLVRLAQMARATGIHMVIATQRPSTDVVTGLIKANFPARASFAVASSIDSRVILDTIGAESLLGHGDMLFLPPEVSAPIRVQGVMVSDQEVERVITFWQQSIDGDTSAKAPPWEEMVEQAQELADRDDLIEQAIEMVRQEQRASSSMLQRRLRIGYPRAARLIDELEELGVVGPAVGGGREREVLIGPEMDE
jgi:S-DNA-T family DNA segregation ATPase FtsK/SpoIIIE